MKRPTWKLILASISFALATLLLPSCGGSSATLEDFVVDQQNPNLPQGPAPTFTYRVLNTYPHDPDAFTQGLLFANGSLFESTGLVGQSSLREVDLTTGNVIFQVDNDPSIFAEGLALRGNQLYQLTLEEGVALVWSQTNFVLQNTITSRVPAWGLTYIPQSDLFVFSDGTSTLRFLQPGTFQETGSVTVTDNGTAVDSLNELEYVNGVILANRFLTDEIVAIDPSNGAVLFRADLTGIIDKNAEGLGFNDVLNGIAYDPTQDRLFVTGKRWPFLYEIDIIIQ